MRGLEEIIASNNDPAAHHRSREPQHGRHFEGADTNRPFESNLADKRRRDQAFHGERVEARQRINGQPFNDQKPSKGDAAVAGILADLAVGAIIDSILGGPRVAPRHLGLEGIHSAIDAEPPFLKFWQKLNDHRAEQGLDEAGYGEAKSAFLGGKTPLGSLTFIGKEWDGVRAVPTKAYEGRKSYRGEFRQVSDNGTVWRTVHSSSGEIAYASPEAALAGALTAKNHFESHR